MYFQITSTADRVVREINGLGLGLRTSTRDLLERAVDEVARPAIGHQFQVAGEPPWEELADSTAERRERAGLGDRPLVATGRGLLAATSRDRWAITRDAATYPGGGWPEVGGWIRFHQAGAQDGHFPARPFVQLQPEDERALDRVGLAWIDGNLRRAGF